MNRRRSAVTSIFGVAERDASDYQRDGHVSTAIAIVKRQESAASPRQRSTPMYLGQPAAAQLNV